MAIFSVFCLLFDENNEISRKSQKYYFFFFFFFIQIAYIILVKRDLVENAVNTPKNVEKHVIYLFFFQKKKYVVAKFSVFCLLFDENNEISRKSSKN